MSPIAQAPMRLIAPGESVSLPETHFGTNSENFDSAIQNWHRHLRANILPVGRNGNQPVIYNVGIGATVKFSESFLMQEIDNARELGAELLMVDAGWYSNANTDWNSTTGDWEHGDWLPNDLFPVFDYARSKGMMCGLWVDVESAGKDSKLAKEHPDWFITRYGKPIDRVLDLSKPEVAAYVEECTFQIIDRYKLDMFRIDHNNNPAEGGFNLYDGKMENTLWRHVEIIHKIFDKVRKQYPEIHLENCAGGSGRMDLGMMERFTTTWVSDCFHMPRGVRILNGSSMALPPEYVSVPFGATCGMLGWGNPETIMQLAILGHPVIVRFGLTGLADANPHVTEIVKKYVGIYKGFIRTFHRNAKVYHHTPVIKGLDSSGYCALEYVSEDGAKAVACVFRLANAKGDEFTFRFRGLDPARKYKITFEPGGTTAVIDGVSLIHQGLPIRLDTALTSSMMLCEASL
jgi:alpha-galactosidase